MKQKTKIKVALTFKDWFDNHLPYTKRKATREEIVSKCNITPRIFFYWTSGDTTPPLAAQEVINTIANQKLDYLTGAKRKAKYLIEKTTSI